MASRTARKGTSRYKIRNWKQYEAGLIQRGSISLWINDDAIDQWNPEAKDKTRERQEEYSDLAIQICLTFRLIYSQALALVHQCQDSHGWKGRLGVCFWIF